MKRRCLKEKKRPLFSTYVNRDALKQILSHFRDWTHENIAVYIACRRVSKRWKSCVDELNSHRISLPRLVQLMYWTNDARKVNSLIYHLMSNSTSERRMMILEYFVPSRFLDNLCFYRDVYRQALWCGNTRVKFRFDKRKATFRVNGNLKTITVFELLKCLVNFRKKSWCLK